MCCKRSRAGRSESNSATWNSRSFLLQASLSSLCTVECSAMTASAAPGSGAKLRSATCNFPSSVAAASRRAAHAALRSANRESMSSPSTLPAPAARDANTTASAAGSGFSPSAPQRSRMACALSCALRRSSRSASQKPRRPSNSPCAESLRAKLPKSAPDALAVRKASTAAASMDPTGGSTPSSSKITCKASAAFLTSFRREFCSASSSGTTIRSWDKLKRAFVSAEGNDRPKTSVNLA
mmetsp:Transcript_39231/g.98679  ORF Transcript_39231/g.98679 Transcript_39231/m.98679 type:complete len:239 (+) Transcript_39231:15-731(+)